MLHMHCYHADGCSCFKCEPVTPESWWDAVTATLGLDFHLCTVEPYFMNNFSISCSCHLSSYANFQILIGTWNDSVKDSRAVLLLLKAKRIYFYVSNAVRTSQGLKTRVAVCTYWQWAAGRTLARNHGGFLSRSMFLGTEGEDGAGQGFCVSRKAPDVPTSKGSVSLHWRRAVQRKPPWNTGPGIPQLINTHLMMKLTNIFSWLRRVSGAF